LTDGDAGVGRPLYHHRLLSETDLQPRLDGSALENRLPVDAYGDVVVRETLFMRNL